MNTVAVSAVLATVATFAGLMLSRTTAFADFNLWTFDFLVNHDLGAHPMAPIVVVDFDDATFARLQTFPIPRREIASVV
ncbi:MAG: CHASE2 domain-containing protein, partial [Acidobacteriaceae bacterium]|nr:CHASE2 domain-containing protein [Acidobacteriaceae bacterium]